MSIHCRFYPLLVEKGSPIGFSTLELSESELAILWFLCENGPRCAYEIDKETYYLPTNVRVPEVVIGKIRPDKLMKKVKEKRRNHRPFIVIILKRLEKKGLLRIVKDTSGDRAKNVAEPTFSGLMLYLTYSLDDEKFKHALLRYSKLVPFFSKWDEIKSKLGEEKCKNALERTVRDFVEIRRVKFQVRSLRLKFEGFLESPKMFMREAPEVDIIREIDTDVAQYLRSKEALLLKKSYIAYLIVHDIHRLSGESKERVKQIVSKLESEKELAYLESKQTEANLLFKDNRLKEFVPENADIGHFFTGMFVKNLLWNEKIIEKKKEEAKASDYEVEFY